MGAGGTAVVVAGIGAAVKASLRLLEELNDYFYYDDYIICHWNNPSVRKSREEPLCFTIRIFDVFPSGYHRTFREGKDFGRWTFHPYKIHFWILVG